MKDAPPRRHVRMPLLFGLAASLVVHAVAIIPLLTAVMTARGQARHLEARFEPEDFRKLPPPPPPEVNLGLDDATASTLTWIGYEEYEEHLAALAEVEQAAFTPYPGGAVSPAPPNEGEPAAPPEPQDDRAADSPVTDEGPAEGASPFSLPAFLSRLDALGPLGARETQPVAAGEAMGPLERDAPSAAAPGDGKKDGAPKETGDRSTPLVNVPPGPAAPAPEVGEPADKQSDPTPTVRVSIAELRIGRPLAAAGLEIKTQKPEFTILMRLTAAPGNPLCELRFRRDGKPARCLILRSSGDSRVDAAIQSSLYRWRAKGKKLEDLADGETVTVRIRIVLGR